MIHILLAAYNEEAALGPVLNGIARALADGNHKVWLVDDGSTDGTARVAGEWRGRLPLVFLRHEVNQGLGAALQTGLAALWETLAEEDIVITLDADDTHPPALLGHLAAPIEEGRADLVIASRFAPGARVVGVPVFRRFTARAAALLFRLVVPLPGVRDYTCGYRAYSGRLLRAARARWGRLISETGFAIQAEWLARVSALQPRVVEIPFTLRYDRKPTPSKMPVGRTVLRTLFLLRRLRAISRPA